ncbi:amidohydrolase family protein [Pseudomarimonas salicorniae]|uniref:Amidohydrolase family protein n=1 Tax=Pseudomarimonas salicorniae TaxID=2933270 RepID=A0ABT0GCS8_9GAMM|nr:amidohydrolase family protein [Lysobacter sp. CAU 1642]MCK7592341.1 amidohydrolase family protein [Lysobacter sp. CAU 1642]
MSPRLAVISRFCSLAVLIAAGSAAAAIPPAPDRDEGEGPFGQLILRDVSVVNGTGAPAFGPVDIVIEGNTIRRVQAVGDGKDRPELAAGGRELQLAGHFVLPGLVDLHGHIGGDEQGVPAEYVYKLWLGHGITSVRDPGCGNGLDWCVSEMRRSERNEIAAPRIFPYAFFGSGRDAPMTTSEEARDWVRGIARKGALGMKCFGYRPDVLQAAFEELSKLGLRAACHHAQLDVARVNVLTTARWGLTTMEHWYGLPEALFDGRTVQDYPADYNYYDEQHRFTEAGKLWAQAAKPGSKRYEAVIGELLERGVVIDPTFNIYAASRDVMRERQAEWHETYTWPSLWTFFTPSRSSHGSYFFDWGTEQELLWKDNYRRWMAFVNDYKNRGGRVTVGSDSGYIYKVYGFGTIHELELLREAGFHPLEVIRAATLHGAEALGAADRIGSIEPGKRADLLVIEGNPLANLKLLYGTGHPRLGEDGEVHRIGGVDLTIKDGIVYDAKALLREVAGMVAAEKRERGWDRLPRH